MRDNQAHWLLNPGLAIWAVRAAVIQQPVATSAEEHLPPSRKGKGAVALATPAIVTASDVVWEHISGHPFDEHFFRWLIDCG
jgi:hypothetical protein